MPKYKLVKKTMTVSAALSEAQELSGLAGEIGEWRDKLQGTAFENTDRYRMVEEAADSLEDLASQAEEACADLDGLPQEVLALEVTVSLQEVRSRRQTASRAVRLSNVASTLRGAIDAISDWLDGDEERSQNMEKETAAAMVESHDSFLGSLENLSSALDEVEALELVSS